MLIRLRILAQRGMKKKCIPFRLRPQLLKECYNLGEGKMLLSKQASPIVSV
jgi:hypothetical protein